MYDLLIVDDEPLVQIGMKSMLPWEEYQIRICGIASNGEEALTQIDKYRPQIVIADVKMPIMDGLTLVQRCKEQYGELPLFILLTSYDDFQFAREAIRYDVCDYIIKMELTPDLLAKSIVKLTERLDARAAEPSPGYQKKEFRDKFFIRLLHNLFDNNQQFQLQLEELQLDFSYDYYVCASCAITCTEPPANSEVPQTLYTSTTQMAEELLNRHLSCYTVSLDLKHFCIIFCFRDIDKEDCQKKLMESLENICQTLHNYFNVAIHVGVGTPYDTPSSIASSYQEARLTLLETSPQTPLLFFTDQKPVGKYTFNIALFRKQITTAFEEFDAEALSEAIQEITTLFESHPTYYTQALDLASNILFLAITMLPEREASLERIFAAHPDSYRSLYRLNSTAQIIEWLDTLKDGLCQTFAAERKNYKYNTVIKIQNYIKAHCDRKLTLNEVSDVFGLSPNYLSSLFKKNSDYSFTEYINLTKVNEAKKMMQDGNLKIYEIAERLGFENAFYFSRVFKKIEGCSPRDFQKKTTPD